MNVIIFGATGMIGQGVLRECLADPQVERVLAVGRTPLAAEAPKLRQLQPGSFLDYAGLEADLAGYDACFFCLGVSSLGMKEADYRHITYDYTLAAGRTLVRLNPGMSFLYVSGAGTGGRSMWARVKGETEDALLALPFKATYLLRPGFIQPLHGIRSKTPLYHLIYRLTGALVPLLKRLLPGLVLTTEELGRAMIRLARDGYPRPRLEVGDLRAAGAVRP
ncbi:MAG: epimerase [Holophaga sp.]|nr:epimerase [Holophaga sp.]